MVLNLIDIYIYIYHRQQFKHFPGITPTSGGHGPLPYKISILHICKKLI